MMETAMFWSNGAELGTSWVKADKLFGFGFFKQDGKKIPCMWTSLFPNLSLWIYTLLDWRKKTQGVNISQSCRYFPLWEMWIFKQREMCSMSPGIFSLLSFTHRKGDQPSMILNSSNTLALTPLFSDQTGKKASQYSGSIFTICSPRCLMLDSTHLERKDWGKIGLLLHHMPAANGSYHTRSHFCKLIFKSKSHRNLVGAAESPWPCQ